MGKSTLEFLVCRAAAAPAAGPPERLRPGERLPREVMLPRVVVSLQTLTYDHKLYTTC